MAMLPELLAMNAAALVAYFDKPRIQEFLNFTNATDYCRNTYDENGKMLTGTMLSFKKMENCTDIAELFQGYFHQDDNSWWSTRFYPEEGKYNHKYCEKTYQKTQAPEEFKLALFEI